MNYSQKTLFKMSKSNKDAFLKFRISEDEKQLFKDNAELQGFTSVSEFIRNTLINNCWKNG